jgi:PAS domain S-box-containing protein
LWFDYPYWRISPGDPSMSNVAQIRLPEAQGEPDLRLSGFTPAAGKALIQGDSFFRALVAALPAAIYTTDAQGRITYFNEAAAALWGHRPELGKSEWCGSWKLFWPDGRVLPHDQCPMAIAVKEQRILRGVEAVAERPDGTRIPFIPFPTPIYDDSGEFLGAVNMLVDITERKQGEEALQRLASIVESSDDAIISKNLDGTITSWNAGAERLYGYLAEEIIGKSIKVLIPPDHHSEEDRILERIRRGQRIEHYETVRQRKHGSLIHVSLTVSPIRDAHGKIVGASKIARDITERKRSEAQMAMLAREAEHRVKNLLSTVMATVHLTQADTPEATKQAIKGRIQALANVHSLFAESRWSGAQLHALITQELSPYCPGGSARLRIEGPDLLLEPNAAQNIAMVLHELATNAAKYGALSVPEGRVGVECFRVADGRLRLRWSETGGPPVKRPARQGFGTRIITEILRGQLRGETRLDWRPEGLCCEIVITI